MHHKIGDIISPQRDKVELDVAGLILMVDMGKKFIS